MEDFNVYKDIQDRTNGEIYIGVVGPVRTGKSTFIKKFMDTVLSYSGYDTGVTVMDSDHIVTLSTCVNTDRNYRYLVHGKLVQKIQN